MTISNNLYLKRLEEEFRQAHRLSKNEKIDTYALGDWIAKKESEYLPLYAKHLVYVDSLKGFINISAAEVGKDVNDSVLPHIVDCYSELTAFTKSRQEYQETHATEHQEITALPYGVFQSKFVTPSNATPLFPFDAAITQLDIINKFELSTAAKLIEYLKRNENKSIILGVYGGIQDLDKDIKTITLNNIVKDIKGYISDDIKIIDEYHEENDIYSKIVKVKSFKVYNYEQTKPTRHRI